VDKGIRPISSVTLGKGMALVKKKEKKREKGLNLGWKGF